jgi:predicted nucleic acid-binding Zn ribbon protein
LKKVRSIRRDSPKPVGDVLAELTLNLGIDKTLDQYGVVTGWEALVGEQIARAATPQRMENGILFVGVRTAPWRAELTMRRREIIDKINHALGKRVVSDIRFR